MEILIPIIISFSVFGFFILIIVLKLKNQSRKATTQRPQPPRSSMPLGKEMRIDYFDEDFAVPQEGMPTVKKVSHKHHNQQQPTVEPETVTEDEELDESLLPDFTDDDEVRKAIIASEILERKY